MPQARKTRQQKIYKSEQSIKPNSPEPDTTTVVEKSIMPMSHSREIEVTQQYVIGELKRIGWISLVCAVILMVATIFLADFGWASAVRGWLPF